MQYFSHSDLLAAEKQFRTNLVNCLSGVRTAQLLGSQNAAKQTNLAIFNSAMHIGANPPLLGLIFRPLEAKQHSLQNILSSGYYTLNSVPTDRLASAHQCSARFEADVSEFDANGFTPWYSESHPAPFVAESALRIGLKLAQKINIESNGTMLIIGEVQEVWVAEGALERDGNLRFDLLDAAGVGGLDTYYRFEAAARFPYAKPGITPVSLI
jgi:flavin reductase (DIM6/NTAB) family NADH-FMN oxidoreductase RutF